ncbi:hypothetical protein TNCV_2540481 [Trichonephila clavipes]|nr:hypothetical protein TNCV_2540481 [Trichonephila clavipes]
MVTLQPDLQWGARYKTDGSAAAVGHWSIKDYCELHYILRNTWTKAPRSYLYGKTQWRNGEHLSPPAKSGLGPPSWILQRAGTWRQKGFGAPAM